MVEILKSNWFVVLIGIIILSFVVYFVYDENKYNVKGKSVDGQELLAAVGDTNITADEFYEEEGKFDQSLLYQMYKIAVLNESITPTSEMKSDAKTLESTIRTNFESNYGEDYETTLNQQLANYGFSGDDVLYQYCITSELEKEANRNYIDDHYDEEEAILSEKSPRTISILYITVADSDNLTEDEQQKMDDIDALIESDGFAAAVKAFSEDTDTVDNDGFYGYVDSDDETYSASTSSTTSLDGSIVTAAIALEKGGVSDWITVNDYYGYVYMYKVMVNETDIKTMYEDEDDDVADQVLYAFISADTKLQYNAIQTLADQLDITFDDESVKEKIESYIEDALADEEDEEEAA